LFLTVWFLVFTAQLTIVANHLTIIFEALFIWVVLVFVIHNKENNAINDLTIQNETKSHRFVLPTKNRVGDEGIRNA